MSAKWKELVQEYKNTCTVPKHPKKCPDCDSKVSIPSISRQPRGSYLHVLKRRVSLAPYGNPQTRRSVRKKQFIHIGSNQG